MSITPELVLDRQPPVRRMRSRRSGLTVRRFLDLGRTESMMCRRPSR